MTITKKTPKRFLFSAFFILFIIVSNFGQQQQYQGDFKVGEYEGKAEYTYRVVGIDTLLDGPFKVERSNLQALLEKQDRSFSIIGSFKEGFPFGDWQFQFGEFDTDSTAQVSGFQYQINVNGGLEEAMGAVNQGKPNGKWRLSQTRIKNSQVQDTLFYSEINFEDGVPQQSFRMENGRETLIGRFLRNGKAHDTWALYSSEAENLENWHFDNGTLVRIERLQDGSLQNIPVFAGNNQVTEAIPFSKGFGTLIALYAKELDPASFKQASGINGLLLENKADYDRIKGIFAALGTKNFSADFNIQAPYFPLDSLKVQQLDSTLQMATIASKQCKELLNNTRLNLMKRSDEDAQYLFEVIAAMDSVYVTPLDKLVSLGNDGLLDNLSMTDLMAYIFPDGIPSRELLVASEVKGNTVYVGPMKGAYDATKKGVSGLLDFTAYVASAVKTVASQLESKLEADKEQQEFVQLEEQMIATANALTNIPDTTQNSLNEGTILALSSINAKAETLLSNYAEFPAGPDKLARAKELVNCLENFQILVTALGTLPQKQAELQEKYTDAVWNPFTATIMDERVKKRITAAYNNVALPYLLTTINEKISCENVAQIKDLYDQLHVRMLELREEDTSKLERKLRKEDNPKVVLQLFNLKPVQD